MATYGIDKRICDCESVVYISDEDQAFGYAMLILGESLKRLKYINTTLESIYENSKNCTFTNCSRRRQLICINEVGVASELRRDVKTNCDKLRKRRERRRQRKNRLRRCMIKCRPLRSFVDRRKCRRRCKHKTKKTRSPHD